MGINADLYDYQNTETNTFYVATTSSVPYCARLRNNANVYQQYNESNVIQTKFFNPDQKTILIVHGF
ncbi:hypothetical protein TSAR_008993, partial [Trichomalopsis sarcophagae]